MRYDKSSDLAVIRTCMGERTLTRILVIDDNKHVLDMLRLTLEHAGYEVDEASDGKTGIDIFNKNPADLVITDIVMPEKEGLETIAELRRNYPNLKIIAISGSGAGQTKTYLASAKSLGALKVFSKPFRREELLSAIAKLLQAD